LASNYTLPLNTHEDPANDLLLRIAAGADQHEDGHS
jgi:hypothetical protein